jgi:hypothetical protein
MRTQAQSASDVSRAPIRPELVAGKLAAIRNYEYPRIQRQIEERPRLIELLWFVQAMSLRPGGLAKFAEEILAAFPERLGTPIMRKVGPREYSLEEKIAAWNEMPTSHRPYVNQSQGRVFMELLPNWNAEDVAAMDAKSRARLEAELKGVDAGFLRDQCRKAALAKLPFYLFALCTEKGKGFEDLGGDLSDEQLAAIISGWCVDDRSQPFHRGGAIQETRFLGDTIGAVIEMIDRRAGQVQRRLAMTDVAKLVFDALDYALGEKVMVMIEGASRFGKTEASETWCGMRPGLARLVRVPCDNSMDSFLKRIGEALGIDCSYGSNVLRLKERIEYVIRHSGLFLVLDEGAFLIPQSFTETAAPKRLNWVRTEIVDRNLPLAIAVTPQSFEPAVDRFVKKTHYTMEQFFGRNFLTRRLPATISEADMIAVARVHFPGMDEDILGYIASEARLSQNYLQAVEAIAKLARWKAAKANRRLGLRELKAAVAEVLPRETASAGASGIQDHGEDATEGRRFAGRAKAPLTAICRPVKPAPDRDAEALDLPARSLRGAGPGREEAEPVSADS